MSEKRVPFSKRNGFVPAVPTFQPGVIPPKVRVWFWNFLIKANRAGTFTDTSRRAKTSLSYHLWEHFFGGRIDQFNDKTSQQILENVVLKEAPTFHLIDLMEKVVFETDLADPMLTIIGYQELESILEAENTSYRVVDGMIIEVGSSAEAASIEEACNCPFEAPRKHIQAALKALKGTSDDDSVRSSIKESISAVEAAFEELIGTRCKSIDAYLKEAEKRKIDIELHPCFQKGLGNFYSYTSDAKGIRHALNEGGDAPRRNDALFMVTICSAAVSMLLRAKASSSDKK